MKAADISAALADRIESLAIALTGERPAYRHGDEVRFRANHSLVIQVRGARRGIWCDHADGQRGGDALDLIKHLRRCNTVDALAWAAAWLGQPAAPQADRQPSHPTKAAPPKAFPERLWTEAARGGLAETYLTFRKCRYPEGDVIRFHPACPRGESERQPAMIALMTDPVSNAPVGIHRTFLRPDGKGKIEHGTAKMMLGSAGIIRLAPDDESTIGLGICEGIETGLAIMQRAGWGAIWACGSAGGIGKFPVLAGIEALTIFPDRDDSGTSLKNANQCAERWQSAGREVRIIWPPAGADWDDALKGEAA